MNEKNDQVYLCLYLTVTVQQLAGLILSSIIIFFSWFVKVCSQWISPLKPTFINPKASNSLKPYLNYKQ